MDVNDTLPAGRGWTARPLERFFRDIHVATQHRLASPEELYQVGKVFLNGSRQ